MTSKEYSEILEGKASCRLHKRQQMYVIFPHFGRPVLSFCFLPIVICHIHSRMSYVTFLLWSYKFPGDNSLTAVSDCLFNKKNYIIYGHLNLETSPNK